MNDTRVIDAWTSLAQGAFVARYCSAVAAAWGTDDGVCDLLALGRHTEQHDAPPLRAQDRFDLASLTKVLATATALALAYQHGKLDLDAALGDWPQLGVPSTLHPLTIRQLVTHTSGLSNRKPDPTLRGETALHDWFNQVPAPPGERRFCYACINAVLASRAAEICLNMTIDEILAKAITRPLGLSGMRFGPIADDGRIVPTKACQSPGQIADEPAHAIGRPVGNAGVFASVLDVGATAAALLAAWHGQSTALALNQAAVAWMWQPVANTAGIPYGVLWDRRSPKATNHRPCWAGDDAVGHSGWTGHSLWIDPPRNRFVVVLTNRSSMPGMTGATQPAFIDTTNRMRGLMGDVVGAGDVGA